MALFRTYNTDSEQQLTLPVTVVITLLLLALTLFTFPTQAEHTGLEGEQTNCMHNVCNEESNNE